MSRMVRSSRSSGRWRRLRGSPFTLAFKNHGPVDEIGSAGADRTRIRGGRIGRAGMFSTPIASRWSADLDSAVIRRRLERGDCATTTWFDRPGSSVAWSRLAEFPELIGGRGRLRASPAKSAGIAADLQNPESARDSRAERLRGRVRRFRSRAFRFPAHSAASPDWVELRNDSDDVAFPVINDLPPGPRPQARAPKRPSPPRRADGCGPKRSKRMTKTLTMQGRPGRRIGRGWPRDSRRRIRSCVAARSSPGERCQC